MSTAQANQPTPPILLLDHDPDWHARGLALAEELRAALAPLPLHVEHIGSTAIPGMAAKPVLDLQITVAEAWAAETGWAPHGR